MTGSHGFIGTHLVKRLQDEGHEVVCVDTKIGKDLLGYIHLTPPKVDLIYHLACVNQMEATKDGMGNTLVNAHGAWQMAGIAKMLGAKLVYTSTASVYGNADQIPTPVTAKTNPKSDYAVAKLAGEGFIRNSGCDFLILRLSNVYGPGQTLDNPYCGVIGRFIENALNGKPIEITGDGMDTRDFTYVDDVVDWLVDGGTKNRIRMYHQRTYNLSRGIEVSVNKIASLVRERTVRVPVVSTAPRAVDGVRRRCLSSDLVCVTDIEAGISRTVEWFRGEYSGGNHPSQAGTARV